MKTSRHSASRFVFLILLACCFGTELAFPAMLSVSPGTTSNTYPGAVTLQISELNDGETVRVEKFLDLNSNGAVEAGDWLVESFLLTDGQALVIGSVTNRNVPGDTDSAPGQITARLNLQTTGIEQRFVGKYAFKMSSPAGRFAPITNLFTITNSAYAQSFSGTVRSGGSNVPFATVLVFTLAPGEGGVNPLGGAVADSAGNYAISAAPGTYLLSAFQRNYVADFKTAPVVTLNAGATIVTNLNLVPATRAISGKVVDAANTTLGLPGLLLNWQSTNNVIGIGFTDTNGNFNVGVGAGLWRVRMNHENLDFLGFVGLADQPSAETTTGSVAGLTIALPKGTALFYGNIKDDQNRPLAGVRLYGSNNAGNGPYEGNAITDQTGYYVMAVNAGTWSVSVDEYNPAFANYIFSPASSGRNMSDGQAVQQDFIGQLIETNPPPGAMFGSVSAGASFNFSTGTVDPTGATGDFRFADQDIVGLVAPSGVSWWTGSGIASFAAWLATPSYLPPPEAWTPSSGTADSAGVHTRWLKIGGGRYAMIFSINATPSRFDFYYVAPYGSFTWSDMQKPAAPSLLAVTDTGAGGTLRAQWQPSPSADVAGYWIGYGTSLSFTTGLHAGNTTNYLLTGLADGISYFVRVNAYDLEGNQSDWSSAMSATPTSAAQLQVSTSVLPDATVNTFFTAQLQASGGQPPYSWSLAPGSAALPPGLSLASNGLISGTPTAAGTFYFYVRVTDAATATTDRLLSVSVITAPLQVTSPSLPNGRVGALYSSQLVAAGGQPPYSWSLAQGSAALPPGLSLASDGLISGTPATNGTFYFIITLRDASSASVSQLLSLAIDPAATIFGSLDPGFIRPGFTAAAFPGYVNADGRGGLIWSFVNGPPFDGANNQKLGAIVRTTDGGALDPDFPIGPSLRNVLGVAVKSDGSLLIAGTLVGDFSSSGAANYRVFHVLTNGLVDSAYASPVFDGPPRFLTVRPNGELIVAGGGAVNPVGNGGIATTVRLSNNGSLDPGFHPPIFTLAGQTGVFAQPVVDAQGRIYLAGGFTQVNGVNRPGLVRLLPNGDLDNSFVPVDYTYSQAVRGLVLQGDKVVVAGQLKRTGDPAFYALLRLNPDGSLDGSFNLVTTGQAGFFRTRCLRQAPDGKLLAISQCVARFNSDGTLDNSFTRLQFLESPLTLNNECYWFELLGDGKIIVPTTRPLRVGTNLVTSAFRLNTDGTFDSSFACAAFETQVYPATAAFQKDGRLVVWGTFDKAAGSSRAGLAWFNRDGTLATAPSFSPPANAVTLLSAVHAADDSLYAVFGYGLPGEPYLSNNLVHVLANAQLDPAFHLDVQIPQAPYNTPSLFMQNDKLLVAWNDAQSVLDGIYPFYRLNVDGSRDVSFVGHTNSPGAVLRDAEGNITNVIVESGAILAGLPGGKLISVGSIGASNFGVGRLNADGSLDARLAGPIPAAGPVFIQLALVFDPVKQTYVQVQATYAGACPVSAVLPLADGSLMIAGAFRQIAGHNVAGLAKLLPAGVLDAAFPAGSGAAISTAPGRMARVDTIRLDGTGKLWVTGNFDLFNGVPTRGVVRLNPNGTVDSSFVQPCAYYGLNEWSGGPQTDVALAQDGTLYLLGTYRRLDQTWPEPLLHLVASTAINPEPVLSSPASTGGAGFQFRIAGLAGQNYTIEASSDLRYWSPFLVTNAPGDSFVAQLPEGTNAHGFYRVRLGP